MAIGKVKWFNNAKGYGFILPEDGNQDLFVHYSSIEMDGYKTLKAGQDVEFQIQEGPKGFHAVNIRAVGDAPPDAEGQHPGVTVQDVDIAGSREQADGESPGSEDPPREGAAGSG